MPRGFLAVVGFALHSIRQRQASRTIGRARRTANEGCSVLAEPKATSPIPSKLPQSLAAVVGAECVQTPFCVRHKSQATESVASFGGGPMERRAVLAFAAAVASVPGFSDANAAGPTSVEVDFSVELPPSGWKVKTEVKQAIRLRKEVVFEARQKSTGASVSVVRTPLFASSERGGSDKLAVLSGAFDERAPKSKEDIVDILSSGFDDPAVRRERQWLDVKRLPGMQEYKGPGGQRYVGFRYDAQQCKGTVAEYTTSGGETKLDCDGEVLPLRRHFISATSMPTVYTSMRKQPGEEDRSALVESLWLLDVSAPVDKLGANDLGIALEKIAGSFSVPLPDKEGLALRECKGMRSCFGEAWKGEKLFKDAPGYSEMGAGRQLPTPRY